MRWLLVLCLLPATLACGPGNAGDETGGFHSHGDEGHSHGSPNNDDMDRTPQHSHDHSHADDDDDFDDDYSPEDTGPESPARQRGANGYTTCVFDNPLKGPGRHGGSINPGEPIMADNADDCADRCFQDTACIGMNYYNDKGYCYLKSTVKPRAKTGADWDSCIMVTITEAGEVIEVPDNIPADAMDQLQIGSFPGPNPGIEAADMPSGGSRRSKKSRGPPGSRPENPIADRSRVTDKDAASVAKLLTDGKLSAPQLQDLSSQALSKGADPADLSSFAKVVTSEADKLGAPAGEIAKLTNALRPPSSAGNVPDLPGIDIPKFPGSG